MTDDERSSSVAIAESEAEEEAELHPEPDAGGGAAHAGGIHLPPESLWPITMAFAITIAAFGLITNLWMSIPGIFLFAVALRGWAHELLNAQH